MIPGGRGDDKKGRWATDHTDGTDNKEEEPLTSPTPRTRRITTFPLVFEGK
jgi:hypothetical protein